MAEYKSPKQKESELKEKLGEAKADIKCLVDALERVTIGFRPAQVQVLLDNTKKAHKL